jgi:ATP-binding cassette subfamily C protein
MHLLNNIYTLIKPYGRKKLLIVAVMIILQGAVQTVGVASIMPFLAIAADPTAARDTQLGRYVLRNLPEMSDRTLLITAGMLTITALVITNGVVLMTLYVSQRYMRGLSHWMRTRLTWQLATREYGFFLQRSTAVLMKKVNGDARAVANQVLQPLLVLTAGIVNISLLVIALLWVDPLIATIAAAILGGAYLIVFGTLSKFRRGFSRNMKEISRETNRKIQQLFGGIKPIKVQGVERPFIEEFENYSHREAILQAKQQMLLAAPKQIIEPVAFGTLVVIVLFAAGRGESLTSILPTLGLMAMAAYRLMPNIQNIYTAAMGIGSHSHVLEEVLEEFDAEGSLDQQRFDRDTAAFKPLHWDREIRLENVSFAYPGTKRNVIDDLSLMIPKKSSMAIAGATGCGKSTLVDLILGLHQPTRGEIWIDDVPLHANNLRAWQTSIGYVPQDIFLLDDTIRANVALGIPKELVEHARLKEVCRAAQILALIENELPHGWDTQVGERGIRLSGGQRQRIGLARALYRQPELLILDEATSALDHGTESAVVDAVKSLSGSMTMLIVAHRLSTISWCDYTIELHESALKAQ